MFEQDSRTEYNNSHLMEPRRWGFCADIVAQSSPTWRSLCISYQLLELRGLPLGKEAGRHVMLIRVCRSLDLPSFSLRLGGMIREAPGRLTQYGRLHIALVVLVISRRCDQGCPGYLWSFGRVPSGRHAISSGWLECRPQHRAWTQRRCHADATTAVTTERVKVPGRPLT